MTILDASGDATRNPIVRLLLGLWSWGRVRAGPIGRAAAYIFIILATAALGLLCYGYVGPPG